MLCTNDTPLFDFSSNSTKRFIQFLATFQQAYAPVHGFICVAICTFGIVTNLVHVLVLTRPSMRCSAVNCVLTAVAICDMGTMASYLVYICHFVLRKTSSCSPTYSHLWMQFLLWHVVLSIALHTTSLWLAVAMAFIRRMTLKVARLNSEWQRPQFAWRVCMGVYVVVFILCIPTLLVHDIIEYTQAEWHPPPDCEQYYPANYSAKLYTLHIPESATANGCRFFKLNLWMSGVLFKVIPCVLLFFLSIGLMMKLHNASRKRRALLKKNSDSSKKHTHVSDRTTAMLICILIVFLITELPQGILAILNAIYTTHVHMYIYFHLGDILDLLSLLNSSINFVLYCVMSSRYRNTFWTVVLPPHIYRYFCTKRTPLEMISSMPAARLKPQNRASKILTNNNTARKHSRKPGCDHDDYHAINEESDDYSMPLFPEAHSDHL